MKSRSIMQKNVFRRCSRPSLLGVLLLFSAIPGILQATAPFVVLTAPYPSGNLGQFLLGSDVVCSAVARDVDGSGIANYEFSVDSTVVQSSTQNFYVYHAFGVATPAITVIVTDGDGETASADIGSISIVNRGFIPSLVELETPKDGSSASLNSILTASGTVDSAGEALGGLIFIENGAFVSEEVAPTSSSFSFQANASEEGTFSYFVVSHYSRDVTEGPADNRITVTWTMANISNIATLKISDTNVVVSSPVDGTDVKLNSPFQILATATSGNSAIEEVKFYVDGVLIETDTLYPFSAYYTPTQSGDILVGVEATDTRGDVTSDSVSVTPKVFGGVANITTPVNGFQFSVFEAIDIEATVNPLTNSVSQVTFFANGEEIGIKRSTPYEVEFTTDVPGDYVFLVKVLYDDGTEFTSPGVATQIVFNPLSNSADFVVQSFLDFFGVAPPPAVQDDFTLRLNDGTLTRTAFLSEIVASAQGGDGTSIIGAYSTVLRRFPDPAEFQAGMLAIDTSTDTGSGSGNIPISVGDTVSGTISSSFDLDTFEFEITGTGSELIVATIASPVLIGLTFRTEAGDPIVTSADGFATLDPTVTATLQGPATFLLDVRGIGTGAYTLTLSGNTDATPGVSGSLVLTTLLQSLFSSTEYTFTFGPVPTLIGIERAIVVNRENLVNQLYASKYDGGGPSDLQVEQGSIRMSVLGGNIDYTEIFITEAKFTDGSELLVHTTSKRPFWQTGYFVTAMFNEQPTNASIGEFTGASVTTQLDEMQDDPRYLNRFPPIDSVLLGGEANDSGWVDSPWLGLTNLRNAPWYYNMTLAWLYTSSLSPESVWFYSPGLGWFWTSDSTYPFIYITADAGWFYVLGEEDGLAILYDVNTGEVVYPPLS